MYGRRELLNNARFIRVNTIQIAEEISESHYGYRATPESRSVGEMLVHIAWLESAARLFHEEERVAAFADFDLGGLIARTNAEERVPRSKAEIVELLRASGDRWTSWIEQLSDDTLREQVAMPDGSVQTRFEMLVGMHEHEIHHRAQLTMLERLVGVVPHFTRALNAALAGSTAIAGAA